MKRFNFIIMLIIITLLLTFFYTCTAQNSGSSNDGDDNDNNPTYYTVTYNGNGNTGGSVPIDNTSYTESQIVTVLGNTGNLERGGYSFAGWNTQADGNGITYTEGQSFIIGNANANFYAVWPDLFAGVLYRDMVSISGGTYFQTDDGINGFNHTISSFSMAKYEVTYELWYTVYQWAISNGYIFANSGIEGNDGTSGSTPTTAKYEPVTGINWRDIIVWCNAYSEMAGLTPIYYTEINYTIPLKISTKNGSIDTTSGSEDNPYVYWSANGYRLPTEGEWQFAASNKGVTPYNYASGDSAPYDTSATIGNYAWYNLNSTSTNNVGTKTANQLAIYDMSGNIWEWCWDWTADYPGDQDNYRGPDSGSSRIGRGGYWNYGAGNLRVGYRSSSFPGGNGFNNIGFRVVRAN